LRTGGGEDGLLGGDLATNLAKWRKEIKNKRQETGDEKQGLGGGEFTANPKKFRDIRPSAYFFLRPDNAAMTIGEKLATIAAIPPALYPAVERYTHPATPATPKKSVITWAIIGVTQDASELRFFV
jgi:hypothetical protein